MPRKPGLEAVADPLERHARAEGRRGGRCRVGQDVVGEVHGRERCRVQRRPAPAVAHQQGQPHDADQHDRNPRAHEPQQAQHEARRVAPADRTVVVGEHQLAEDQGDGAGEADLERPDDVLAARAEEHERCREHVGDPGPDTGAHHDRPDQGDDREVRGDHDGQVGDVGVEPEDGVEHPERDQRHRGPVGVVGLEEVVEAELALGDEAPVVAEEPHVVGEAEHDDGPGDDQQAGEELGGVVAHPRGRPSEHGFDRTSGMTDG